MPHRTYRLALPAAASIAVLIAASAGWAQQPASPPAAPPKCLITPSGGNETRVWKILREIG